MIPACAHTGTPRHFHSSATSGSACLMSFRIRASVSPRQSPNSLILASISSDADWLLVISAQLLDADHVAGGIAQGAVTNPVRLLRRLLDHFHVAALNP